MAEERVPPQSLEAEQNLLGSMLLDMGAVVKALELVTEECFYSPAHKKIFQAIVNLFQQNVTPDLVTVTDELRKMKELENVGGVEYLNSLVANVISTANVESHAKVIVEKRVKRDLIQAASEILNRGYDEGVDASSLADLAQNLIFSIGEQGLRKKVQSVREIVGPVVEEIESFRDHHRPITGLETGFITLDERTAGLQKGDLIIVAGRPSMGKTAFVLNIATHVAMELNIPVLIFSLEMSSRQLVQRILSSESGVRFEDLRRGRVSPRDWTRILTVRDQLVNVPIWVDDTPSIPVLELKAKSRRLKAELDVGLIIVDYIQLMTPPTLRRRSPTRQEEIAEISLTLKAMSRELDVPVIAVSQLSRRPEVRDDPVPKLSDLRESGALEQDADVVIFLYREEYYNPTPENRGIADVIIAKQRNG
ncbi:replicative DNA helicase, partial [candidate division WOR-3 bacterium]